MNKKKNTVIIALSGVLIGVINGLLGAGGGMIAVPVLNKILDERKQAHANAVAVILPISIISAIIYINRGNVAINDALIYIPTGILGSFIGTFFLKKISTVWLKRIFGGFMLYAGVRLLLK